MTVIYYVESLGANIVTFSDSSAIGLKVTIDL
jgi:hypothetical protein